jgi:hypothetical protein
LHKKPFLYRLLPILLLLFIMVASYSGCGGNKMPSSTFLSFFEGEVLIKKTSSADWVKAEVKALLVENDIIKTGVNSKVSITFFDGSTIDLKPDTQIVIKELVKGKTKTIRLKQDIGETLSKVEKLADSSSGYEIETPVAVVGVRGSQMVVNVAANGATVVQNIEGKISVTAQGVEVLIPEGEISIVEPNQPPSEPKPNTRTIESLVNDPNVVNISDPCGDVSDFAQSNRGADLKRA